MRNTRFVVGAMVVVVVLGFGRRARAQEPSTQQCPAIPVNIMVDRAFRSIVASAIAEVETIRKQCEVIAAARHLRVRIRFRAGSLLGGVRAQATITRYEYGAIVADITIPATSRHVEMLAHELEHVIEQLEGMRLAELAGQGRAGVTRFADGAFETARADRAGRAALLDRASVAAPVAVEPASAGRTPNR